MRSMRRSQRDLFAQERATAELQPGLRSKLKPLLRSLLMEAAGMRQPNAASNPNHGEDGDDQDHA
jgi:hypothetical protein